MSDTDYIKVPVWLAACYDLTWQEKFIYAEILYKHQLENGCTAKQKTIGKKYNIKPDVCSRIFRSLQKKGFISKSEGCITPLKNVDNLSIKVDQKSTKQDNKKLTKSQQKVDQKSTEVDQKSSPHHIYKNKLKGSEKEKEKSAHSENNNPNISLNDEKDSKKKKHAKKEKEPQFGGGRPMTFIYFDIMKDKRPDMFPEKPMEGHLIDLKRIIKSVEAFIRDQKQKAGLPAFNVSKKDLEDNFRVFVDNLPKRILDKHFSTSSIARNIHGYLYEMHAGKLKDNSKGTHDELLAMKEAIRQKRELRKQNHKL